MFTDTISLVLAPKTFPKASGRDILTPNTFPEDTEEKLLKHNTLISPEINLVNNQQIQPRETSLSVNT